MSTDYAETKWMRSNKFNRMMKSSSLSMQCQLSSVLALSLFPSVTICCHKQSLKIHLLSTFLNDHYLHYISYCSQHTLKKYRMTPLTVSWCHWWLIWLMTHWWLIKIFEPRKKSIALKTEPMTHNCAIIMIIIIILIDNISINTEHNATASGVSL